MLCSQDWEALGWMVVLGRARWKGDLVRPDALGVFQPQLRTGCSQLLSQEGDNELVTSFRDRSWREVECHGLWQHDCGFSHETRFFIFLGKSSEDWTQSVQMGLLTLCVPSVSAPRWSAAPSIWCGAKVPAIMWICWPLPATGHQSTWLTWPHLWLCVLTSPTQS